MIRDSAGNTYPDATSAIRAEMQYRDCCTQQYPEHKAFDDAAFRAEVRFILAQISAADRKAA